MKLRTCGLHLAALWALAAVQPLFSVLADEPAFFVARENTAGDILIFAFGWTLIPPLIATAVVAVLKRPAHLTFVALLVSLLSMPLFQGLPTPAALAAAAIVGAAGATLYAKQEPARAFVSFLAIAPPVVLALLLLFSPVSDLVLRSGDEPLSEAGVVRDPKPVVLILFDELPTTTLMRADKTIDAERYPNFARLASNSTWYRNATSVADGTYVAIPALLTGTRPEAELPISREYPRNLFNLLGREYTHHVQEPLTSICPRALCGEEEPPPQGERLEGLAEDLWIVERRLLLPDDLADDLPAIDRDFEAFAEDDLDAEEGSTDLPERRLRAARAVADTLEPDDRGLWLVHHVVPHVPWRFLPDGRSYPVLGPAYPGLDETTWGTDEFLLGQAEQRHVLMSRFADRLLGEAIDKMRRSGLWDDALVIVAADHGGNISAGELRRNVARENVAQIAGVPLFVKTPGQTKPATSNEFVTALDVVPTIVDELDIDTDWAFDGLPVTRPRAPDTLQQRNGPDATLVRATPQEFAADLDASLNDRIDRLGTGLEAIFEHGPRQDLVGRGLAELKRTDPGDERAFLNNAPLYADIDPDGDVLPAYVTGATVNVAPGTDLIVAVNGTVEASGEAYSDHGDERFSMLVRPAALRPGANRIEILAVAGETVRLLVATN